MTCSTYSLCLAETAQVFGDLAARSIDIRSGSSFVGSMHISAFEPIAVVDPVSGKIDPTRKKGQYLLTGASCSTIHPYIPFSVPYHNHTSH